jgi:hypothetical protein
MFSNGCLLQLQPWQCVQLQVEQVASVTQVTAGRQLQVGAQLRGDLP